MQAYSYCLHDRVSETAVQLVQSEIVPEHVRSGLQSLALWIGQSWQVSAIVCMQTISNADGYILQLRPAL